MAKEDVIRDLGDTLVHLLRTGISSSIVETNNIVLAAPDDFKDLARPLKPTITVYLYRVAVSGEMRNARRRMLPDGRTSRPLLPLELHYLITPWARLPTDTARIIGRILQVLYDRAELGTSQLQGSAWEADDTVQLILESLPLEDHNRIWETMDLPYRLSLTYMARVVGLEPGELVTVPPVVEAHLGRAP